MASPDWASMSNEEKDAALREAFKDARARGRDLLLQEVPALVARIAAKENADSLPDNPFAGLPAASGSNPFMGLPDAGN